MEFHSKHYFPSKPSIYTFLLSPNACPLVIPKCNFCQNYSSSSESKFFTVFFDLISHAHFFTSYLFLTMKYYLDLDTLSSSSSESYSSTESSSRSSLSDKSSFLHYSSSEEDDLIGAEFVTDYYYLSSDDESLSGESYVEPATTPPVVIAVTPPPLRRSSRVRRKPVLFMHEFSKYY